MEATTEADNGKKKNDGRCHACGCIGPNPGYEAMSESSILEELATLAAASKWNLAADQKSISRKFVCRNWQAAMNAIQAISVVAESENVQHHPDLHLTNYREIEIVIHTHAVGGLTKYDFFLARGIDQLSFDYSPKWLKANAV